jgi:predicted ATPase
MSRISSICLKVGSAANPKTLDIGLTPITVFVGPNNSGKSLALTEILTFCSGGRQNSSRNLLVDSLSANKLSPAEAEIAIKKYEVISDQVLSPGHILYGVTQRFNIGTSQLKNALTGAGTDDEFCRFYLANATLSLGGSNRSTLIEAQPIGDIRKHKPSTSFQVLFRDESKRNEVRRVLHEAFGKFFALDPSAEGKLRAVFSDREPISDVEELGLNKAALDYYDEAELATEMSDGIKAFTGLITQIVAGEPDVLLVDEPEAFLYPPLAFKLGNEVARLTSKTGKNLFVSTHSAQFVMGCIHSGVPVNIVRLTYRSGIAHARVLSNSAILHMMRNPLLRSVGVVNALFYECVVVTEGDADRAFYQEINDRLLRFDNGRGIPNCLFLNAQNKQTVKTIIKPLRELGIPAAAVVDIDVIKEGGTVWSSFLESAFVPEIDRQALALSRKAVLTKLEETGKNMKRDGGINLLEKENREAAQNLVNAVAQYGLFIITSGELESWLTELGEQSLHGPNWLISIFEKMGEDPTSANYVKPGDGDVWDFVAGIRGWLLNNMRGGLPA